MKTEWDYTELADAYLKRPEYAQRAIDEMIKFTGVSKGSKICDIGAGAAHLTLMLEKKGFEIYAVEPNDAMRKNGIKRTKKLNVKWFEGVGEDTKLPSETFDIVTFGSSFNVCDRSKALYESNRILKKGGYFVCMWNHRDLENHIQIKIENIIKENIDNYEYGTRREDQTEIIEKSGLFEKVYKIEGSIIHKISASDFIEGWKSHGTLHRQSKDIFDKIMFEIERYILSLNTEIIEVPYTTRIWIAKTKK